jgi:CO/xanthine dehydrogenase FAD-binding subunit
LRHRPSRCPQRWRERLAYFDYVKPQTVDHLLEGLRQTRFEGAVLAGGTDLLVRIRSGLACPRVVFDITNLASCRGIVEEKDYLRIGAAVRMAELATSATVQRMASSLAAAARQIGSQQIRNRATLGGNIVAASPAADAIPPLLVADAVLVLVGAEGRRELPLAQFLKGPGETFLGENEVLTEVVIPAEGAGCRSRFVKVARRNAQACSVINLAGRIDIGQDGLVRDIRIALGAVAPTVIRARRAEEALMGRAPSTKDLAEVAALAAEDCRPISDFRATENARKLLVEAWAYRLLQVLCERNGVNAAD